MDFPSKTRSSAKAANTALRLPTKNKNVQKQASLLSQSFYDISVDCANETDPFRQSVRYQQFSRQVEKLGLYGSFREEYIRFLRIAYGSLEYGRTDGLSGISYTDEELRKLYGFDESPGRLNEKMLYQQGYDMGRAERETWGMVAVISIMKELQAIDPKESPEATVGKSSSSKTPMKTKSIYRAVGEREYRDLMETNRFNVGGGSLEAKQFGNDFEEVLDFANKPINKSKVAIIKVTIPEDVYNQLNHMQLDPGIFRSGTPVVEPKMLEQFNNSILSIEHVY